MTIRAERFGFAANALVLLIAITQGCAVHRGNVTIAEAVGPATAFDGNQGQLVVFTESNAHRDLFQAIAKRGSRTLLAPGNPNVVLAPDGSFVGWRTASPLLVAYWCRSRQNSQRAG